MRKVVLYTLMSLDGAVDQPERYFKPSVEPGRPFEFDSVMTDNEAKVIGAQDSVLLGRHMYDEWSQYWPTSDEQPFADFINGVKKYVVTSTPLSNEWHNAEAVKGADRGSPARPQGATRRRHRRSRQHPAGAVAARGRTRRRTAAGGRSSRWIHRTAAVREH